MSDPSIAESLRRLMAMVQELGQVADHLEGIGERAEGMAAAAKQDLVDWGVVEPPSAVERAQERWGLFLDEHPELQPGPLTFTDEELLAAMDEAAAKWNADCAERSPWCVGEDVSTGQVAAALRPCPSKGDVGRVNWGLHRLEAAGRVTRLSGGDTLSWVRVGREDRISEIARKNEQDAIPVLPELTEAKVYEALRSALRRRGAAAVPFEAVHEILVPEAREQSRRTNGRIRYLLVELRKAGRVESVLGGPGERTRLWACSLQPRA